MTDGYYSQATFESLHFSEPLSAEAERQLIAEWQHLGLVASRDKLVLHFALYTSKLAHKFSGGPARRSPQDMQDALAVANAALLRTANEFDLQRPKARFSSLLYLLVRRDVVNWTRDQKNLYPEREFLQGDNRSVVPEETASFEYPREAGDATEAEADVQADADTLLKLVPKLPEAERELMDRVYFRGMSFLEAARDMDIGRGKVFELKRSAFAALRRMLAE